MSSFFEQELWHLFGDGKTFDNPACAGRACLGTLGRDLRVRAQFISTHISGEYDALKLTVLNRTDGPVDTLTLKLKDLLGKKPVPGNPNFRSGVTPHIWDDYGKFEWYAYRPTAADYDTIRQAAKEYLDVFRDRQQERVQDGPKLVYICPHLMFPPIADPENPVQDQAAREMGLRLVESCQQVNVYGTEWTDGMLAEIRHAMDLGIQVKTDQETIGRSSPRRQAARKGKGAR